MAISDDNIINIAPDDENEDVSRLVAVQGRGFWEDYLGKVVMPMRRELAMMVVASEIQAGSHKDSSHEERVGEAFALADAFIQAEKSSLVEALPGYWDIYMERGDLQEILKNAVENATDFSIA